MSEPVEIVVEEQDWPIPAGPSYDLFARDLLAQWKQNEWAIEKYYAFSLRVSFPPHSSLAVDELWITQRIRFAVVMLRDCVLVDKNLRGGIPVLRGTRFPVASVFSELAEGYTVSEIADDFDLDVEQIRRVLEGFAVHLDSPLPGSRYGNISAR